MACDLMDIDTPEDYQRLLKNADQGSELIAL
jgi:CTP:molybdopterin cytidylyltransferase MocA